MLGFNIGESARLLWLGMIAVAAPPAQAEENLMFHFAKATQSEKDGWEIVNDDVMGGISKSRFVITNGVAVFSGDVSLENNGGFASVRSLPSDRKFPQFSTFVVQVRGDGRTYKFTARTSRSFDSALYQAAFKTRNGELEEHRFPVSTMVPTFRGRTLQDAPPLDPTKVTSVGFLISDKQEGRFRLEIAWIKAE